MSFVRLSLFAALSLIAMSFARGAEPTVTAVLTESQTNLGHPVQLQIEVTGASNPKPPGEINVDGLDIRSAGVSRQYQMNNFSVSYSFTYNYTIMPQRVGTFKIPPQNVDVGGKTLRTPELSLSVVNAPANQAQRNPRGGGAPNNSSSGNIDPAQIGFVEMLLPKQSAYVGEMIPVQIRLGLNMRAPVESLGDGVQIQGQGFTTQKMTEPRQTVETVNGRSYQVFIFKTAISPVRAGKLEIGPARINPTVRVASARRPQVPRGFDDPIFDQFFNDPAFAPSMPQEVELKSSSTVVDVKPLPPNAPPGFGGAVGSFTLKTDANPKKVQVGDPITVVSTINGRGNFDRVTGPVLQDDKGWHTYPPNDKFKQDDDVGISGTKTSELVLTPTERKTKLPALTFSFFDPVKETYVTLKSDEIPLQIEGNALPAATAAAASASATPPTAAPTPQPQKEEDILYQMTERPAVVESFTPMYERRSFWTAQLIPLAALAGFVAFKLLRTRASNRDAQRMGRLQREAAELERKLKHDGANPQEYVAAASRTVQLKTALARNVDPNSVDAQSAAEAFRLDEEHRAQLEQLFRESDELRYSGGGNGETLSSAKRREILELVEHLHA